MYRRARSFGNAIVFFDEMDAIGGARHDDADGADHEVQRTMLQIVAELGGQLERIILGAFVVDLLHQRQPAPEEYRPGRMASAPTLARSRRC